MLVGNAVNYLPSEFRLESARLFCYLLLEVFSHSAIFFHEVIEFGQRQIMEAKQTSLVQPVEWFDVSSLQFHQHPAY